MRDSGILACLIVVSFSITPLANAYESITIAKPFIARSLSGIVVDSTGAPVPDLVVERCDALFVPSEVYNGEGQSAGKQMLPDCNREPGHAITTTKTDANGHFAFPNAKSGRTFYLHFSGPGFDPMQIAVKLRFYSWARLRIKMGIAT
jgi:hypothetical protein